MFATQVKYATGGWLTVAVFDSRRAASRTGGVAARLVDRQGELPWQVRVVSFDGTGAPAQPVVQKRVVLATAWPKTARPSATTRE
jgi:hypothetical protein